MIEQISEEFTKDIICDNELSKCNHKKTKHILIDRYDYFQKSIQCMSCGLIYDPEFNKWVKQQF